MVSTSTLPNRPRRFGIIGAGGAAGLATLKVALDELCDYIRAGDIEVVGLEQREDIGGVWFAQPRPDPSKQKWPDSPAYDSLLTNIPHPIMFYPSHLASPSTHLYTGLHTDHSTNQWNVTTRPYRNQGTVGEERISHFDHLLVANGHYRHPFIPDIDGFDAWTSCDSRSYIHSIWYRTPEPYRDCNVLVIGGGRSGADCSTEISTVARKLVQSIRSAEDKDLAQIIRRGAISHFASDGFVYFKNGKREYVDRVIFATGYEYDCSFLTQLPVEEPRYSSDHLYNSRFHIYPLALHTFPLRAAFPPSSLAFIGLTYGVPSFTLAEVQVTLAIRMMTGRVSLDFGHELAQTLARNEELQQEHSSALEVARAWHKFPYVHSGAFNFLDLLSQKANDSRRVPRWTRQLGPFLLVMLAEWRKMEQSGLADEWAKGVGNGGIQEWVQLMWRVVRRARGGQQKGMFLMEE